MTRKSTNYITLRLNPNLMNPDPMNFSQYTRKLHQLAFNALKVCHAYIRSSIES
jgi:hypothetical protein